jgi:mannose-binding lectin 1
LHYRLTTINHQLDILFHDLSTFKTESEKRHEDMKRHMSTLADYNKHLLEKIDGLMDRALHDIEGKSFKEHIDTVHQAVADGNQALLSGMPYAMHGSAFTPSPPHIL